MPSSVSPARAGMDLVPFRISASLDSFPRTCGDGPRATEIDRSAKAFPPHVRGWTRSLSVTAS